MKSKINLYFNILESEPLNKGLTYNIIRLEGIISFKTIEGWSKPFRGILDTGAHTTMLPLSIWKQILCKSIKKSKVQGIATRDECSIPVIIGKVFGQLLDEEGNQSKEIEILSYLALTDEIPLIIGFKDLLERYGVYFSYKRKRAYFENG